MDKTAVTIGKKYVFGVDEIHRKRFSFPLIENHVEARFQKLTFNPALTRNRDNCRYISRGEGDWRTNFENERARNNTRRGILSRSLVLNWVRATVLINAARQVHSAHCEVRPRVYPRPL